ncbi:family 16 glycosylhydrolase [Pontiella agarivorans]|uniref:Family 16 glycosylhydrolase n=1 Tax=Pontiella agarivorans TaxID=3038953 RepID=A0ABU5MTJ1_9BACT|nr:family 16 glycosylhydrolase [Pontiella agarivorans]MDZ8117433.1 family 16 glycosylhydrolase [Pontiella agarivorans]
MRISVLTAVVSCFFLTHSAESAITVVSDDFSIYAPGVSIAGNWDPKSDGGSQEDLFTGWNSEYAVLDGEAELNYHIPHQTGFTIGSGGSAVIRSDFRYVYAGGGNITNYFNNHIFGLMISTTPDWESGSTEGFYIAQRGGAIGNRLNDDPWIEGWISHSTLGVNTDNTDTSIWFSVEWTIRDVGGALQAQAVLTDGDSVNYTSTEEELSIPTGTEIFAGYSTGWNNTGMSIEAFGKILEVHMDNFSVWMGDPEPGSVYPFTDSSNLTGWIAYEPMWDEFDGFVLDAEKWEPLSWDGRKPVYHEYNNVTLSNGVAVLTTDWKDGPVGSVSESEYSISSGYFQSTTVRRYGYFEIKCRALDFPIMTTWWLTGGSSSFGREIDMLECPSGVEGRKDYYSCNFHIWKTPTPEGVDDNGGTSIADPEHYDLPFDMVDDFHVYGFEWDKDSCKIYIDGVLYRTRETGSFTVGQRLMVGNEYNSWLNDIVEINSNLHKLGTSYEVDYVRAWIKPETDTTWYVDGANGDDSYSGLNWTEAKKTIPAAIDEAYDGDSIWVAGGYYPEYLTFYGMHNLKVYGGFAVGDISIEDRDFIEHPTLIDTPPDGYSAVSIKGTQGFRFDGFTVTGTTGNYEHGIDIEGPCTNVVIANCRTIDHNPANGGGSGAYVDGVDGLGLTQVRFENCEFSGNQSFGQYAGGAAFGARNGAVVEIADSQIIHNETSGTGGFLHMQWDEENTSILVTNCLISANTNMVGRGVIRHNCGTVELVDCTIINNSADGVESDQWGSPMITIQRSLIAGNGGEGFWANHSDFWLQDNLFFDHPDGHVNYNGDKSTESAINGLSQASGNRVGDPNSMLITYSDSDLDEMPDWWEVENELDVTADDYESDTDNDGSFSGDEFIAGTNPQDAGSVFKVSSVPDAGSFTIYFDAEPGRLYSIETSDDLSEEWNLLTNGIAGNGSRIEIVNEFLSSNRFYRVTAELNQGVQSN